MRKIFLAAIIVLVSWVSVAAQEIPEEEQDTLPENVLLEKQWYLGVLVHSNGWGLKFRSGKNLTVLHQFMWEIEFMTYKSAKEVRSLSPYPDAKSYIYGKLNYLGFLQGGVGSQHVLNRKPYWGGVQLSAFYYGGLSVGITKPVYLYILTFTSSSSEYEITEEKYNPEIHFADNIYGRASFLSGILNLQFYPAVYVKGGLDFEFGVHNRAIYAFETGATLNYSPIGIPVMAYIPKQHFFLTLYVSFNLGKRHN